MKDSHATAIQIRLLQTALETLGDSNEIRLRLRQGDSEFLSAVVREIDRQFAETAASLAQELEPEEKSRLHIALQDPLFCRRLKDAVMEDLYGERLAPRLEILPEGLAQDDPRYPAAFLSPPDRMQAHAVCVEYLPNICNELYPLMIDSYVYDLSKQGRQRRCVVGVHSDWLDERLHIHRGIYLRPEPETLFEAPLAVPLSPQSVHFLAVSPAFHRHWSERFAERKIAEVNPYESAALADDKYACIQIWQADGVPTPDAAFLPRNEIGGDDALHRRMREIFSYLFRNDADEEIVLVAQPNRGTEGRGAEAYSGSKDWSIFSLRHSPLFEQIRRIGADDDVLLRRGVRNVLVNDPYTNRNVCFDIRSNVVSGRMESGFLMAAAPGAIVASPGRGGHIVEWKPGMEWRLSVPGVSAPILWDDSLLRAIQSVVEKAAARFSECRISGVDIRLEWRNGAFVPNVLDINPRPAGLAHSRYFDTREPGVTQHLWDMLPE